MIEVTRRQAILGTVSVGAVPVAGCVNSSDSDPSNESANQTQESISADDMTFDVTVANQFGETHPAQINAILTNTRKTPFILSTGVTPPFTSYLSRSQSDESQLVLVPDVSEDESPLAWQGDGSPIPTSAENGCWTVTQEVLIEDIGTEIKLDQGESSSQQYDVYGYQNEKCPPSGAYQFEDALRVYLGQPSANTPAQEVTLKFTLTLAGDQSVSVETADTTIKTVED
jgi:hypothetical protein